ncbi:MAG: UTP--glucose-1-phosphate uridylyltransferase [Alphaproteobacteria bacterium]
MADSIRIAVIPAAGLGTRNFVSPELPKEMLPAFDRPLIHHIIDEAREAGIDRFVFVLSPGKEILPRHFEPHPELEDTLRARGKKDVLDFLSAAALRPEQVEVVYQERPLGLGHAVLCANPYVGDRPFAVMLPDEITLGRPRCLEQMMQAYRRHGGNIIAATNVPRDQTNRYGILKLGAPEGQTAAIEGMIEKPRPDVAPSTSAIVGRYILQPRIFSHLARTGQGAGGEIQLTDAMERLRQEQSFRGFVYPGMRHDCGHLVGLLGCAAAVALQHPRYAAEARAHLSALLAPVRPPPQPGGETGQTPESGIDLAPK